MNTKYDTLLLLGKTGSGKGTQAHLLAEKLGYQLFSTGDEFRKLRGEPTPLGKRVKEDYDTGALLPHWIASHLLQHALFNLEQGQGIIFEGTARKEPEAKMMHDVCMWLNRSYVVINLEVSDEEVIRRQLARGRDLLDTKEKITERLDQYGKYTLDAIAFFREQGHVIDVNGEQSPEDVHAAILKELQM